MLNETQKKWYRNHLPVVTECADSVLATFPRATREELRQAGEIELGNLARCNDFEPKKKCF